VQDVLLGVWHGAKHFKGDAKAFTWMVAIVRNKAISTLRRRSRTVEISPDESDGNKGISNPELDAVISGALRKLSAEHRLAVVLTYYLNLSQDQIGSLMHCPLGTVKSRLCNALKQLREVWEIHPVTL
jgi:RNA polymerase sigma-70 factor (ECF subfamily)